MKIRMCFVSNSSSSSFCIYGTYECDLEDLKKKFGVEDLYDLQEKIEETTDLYVTSGPSEDGLYIGESWPSIGDQETGAEFKAKIKEKISKLFGEDVACETYTEGWYD